jgi:hypothetical protein
MLVVNAAHPSISLFFVASVACHRHGHFSVATLYPRPCLSLEHLVPRRSVKVGDAGSFSDVYRSMAIRSWEANTNDGAGKRDKYA